MGSKVKRNFLIAARGHAEWYNAVPEAALAKIKPAAEPLHMEGALQGAHLLSADSKYDLLMMTAGQSAGIRHDIAAVIAPRLASDLPAFKIMLAQIDEAERQYRSETLTLNALDKYIGDIGGREYEDKMQDLVFLRSLPDDAFDRPDTVARLTGDLNVLKQAFVLAESGDAAKTEKIAKLLAGMSAGSLTRLAFSCGISLGDRYDEWMESGMPPSQVKGHFDVPKSVMQHWSEISAARQGRSYDAFATGEGRDRRVFIHKDFVQKKLAGVQP